ncbi:AAA family ATPase [Thermoanaerobacterium thermosaccharolyticum]|uniref:AAA family ATPase n=1 Tax=Thermoanaerobacterium thermosaccharolyticum TaxID=1517 RepID=UPI002FD9D014
MKNKYLLLSTNIDHINSLKSIEVTCTTSIESAKILLERDKYDLIIIDDVSGELDTQINKVKYNDYIKDVKKTKSIEKPHKQEVISIYSVKGGLGKTTLVKEIAENLSKNLKIIIIDLNFQDGGSDLSFMLDLPVLPHIGMYLEYKGTKDALMKSVYQYSENIYVLQAPPKIKLAEGIMPNDIMNIILDCRAMFDVILIDLPNMTNELIKKTLDMSTQIVILSLGSRGEIKRISEIQCNSKKIILCDPANNNWKKSLNFLNLPYIKVNDVVQDINKISKFIFGGRQ